ncbi:MAG: hypothetical protein OEY93_09465 [Anaerolineae bacterium]|nr:hypothetical protein [Anaerolineae bacterium]
MSFISNLTARHRTGKAWKSVFILSTTIGLIALSALILTILNSAYGYAAIENKIDPAALSNEGVPLESQTKQQLISTFKSNVSDGLYRRFDSEISLTL